MAKVLKRKITVNINSKSKVLPKTRPSVFERLGTKTNPTHKEFCHHWAKHGNCPFGKGCKYSATHILISPSKKRAAKKENESKKRHCKESTHKRIHSTTVNLAESPEEEWNQWDPNELDDADPDDLEKRRLELHRQLELQMKMESKAKKKGKGPKRESSPSSASSSSSSDSSSSSEESSSTTSTSLEASNQKKKKIGRHRDSSSSTDSEQVKKLKPKMIKPAMSNIKGVIEKPKRTLSPAKSLLTIKVKSPSPKHIIKTSQTPPPKIKPFIQVEKNISVRPKSPPRPIVDQKEKRVLPSPKALVRDKNKEQEREKALREREREKEKEREHEKEKEREREKEREKEKERERERARIREKERERELERKKRDIRSPRRDSRSTKDPKRRDSPDIHHSRDRKQSPSRSRGSGSGSSRRDNSRKNTPIPYKDDRYSDKKDNDRSREKARPVDVGRRDRRDSRSRDRGRERERRITREEREAAREKEREEALARCQERQRERERIKELQRKQEEEQRNRDRNRRDDRGLDKPTGGRVERLLPLPTDRLPPNRRDHSLDTDKGNRDRNRDNRRERERTPIHNRSQSRKPVDTHNRVNRENRNNRGHMYNRGYNRNERGFNHGRNRDYPRIHDAERRQEGSPYDGHRHDDRHYHELDHGFNENSRDENLSLDRRDYPEDHRPHHEMWEVERDREIDQRRFGREGSQPASLKDRDWEAADYPEHEWERGRRPLGWEGRNWDSREEGHAQVDDEWRHYSQSMDSWTGDDKRRQWSDWRDRSRPRSTASHPPEDVDNDIQTRELVKNDSLPLESEVKKDKPVKKPTIQPPETETEPKALCVNDMTEDDFSEISDDADEILNREEEIRAEDTTLTDSNSKSSEKEPVEIKPVPETCIQPITETVAQTVPPPLIVTRDSPSTVVTVANKEESIEEENIDLDFEEISEDELEEETRIKGLGDALGVDWASLVAESQPRAKPLSSAKRRWESHNILVNLGISVEMAGEDVVKNILKEHAKAKISEEKEELALNKDIEKSDKTESESEEKDICEIKVSHPVAAIQVAIREKEAVRKSLFASAGPYRRALSSRRDLAMRRHLCNLPENDMYVETPKRHDPQILEAALELFERSL